MSQKTLLLLAVVTIAALGGYFTFRDSGLPSNEQRGELYAEAQVKAAESPAWPQTPEDLARRFWEHAARKDWDQVIVFCPGSHQKDFIAYERFTPSPATSVAEAKPHPEDKDAAIVDVVVPFPGSPQKQLAMVMKKGPDGRWFVDGQRSSWW